MTSKDYEGIDSKLGAVGAGLAVLGFHTLFSVCNMNLPPRFTAAATAVCGVTTCAGLKLLDLSLNKKAQPGGGAGRIFGIENRVLRGAVGLGIGMVGNITFNAASDYMVTASNSLMPVAAKMPELPTALKVALLSCSVLTTSIGIGMFTSALDKKPAPQLNNG
ncbi:MAG: hypothetical protein PHW76_09395 [Alphaproteobacteria bacterium]|nr:hypothetical protein [Alphaproteobacteria bacterium]